MKRLFVLSVLVVGLLVSSASGQRSVTRSASVTAVRPVGESRLWTLMSRDSTVGRLISRVKETTEVNGVAGVVLEEKLRYDYTKIGSELVIESEGDHYVSNDGYYLGDEMSLTMGGQTEKLSFRRDGTHIPGYFTRAGQKVERTAEFPANGFGWDVNLLDQLELFLAMRDIKVGDSLIDSVFSAQALAVLPVRAWVEKFTNVRLYNEVFDSAFVIRMSQPLQCNIAFTPDKRLAKVDMLGTSTKAYLDAVSKPKTAPVAQTTKLPEESGGSGIKMVIACLIYLAVAGLSVLLLAASGFRRGVAYIGLLAGVVVFWLVPLLLNPAQEALVRTVVIPHVNSGGAILLWGVLPPLVAGLFQELVLFAAILGIILWRAPKSAYYILVGAFVAAGFGLAESCYVGWTTPSSSILTWSLLERGFMILFHVTAGVIIGQMLMHSIKAAAVMAGVMALVNGVLHYLPVIVQQKLVSVQIMYFIFAFLCLGLTIWALVRVRSVRSH